EILQKKNDVKAAEKTFYEALYAAEEAHDDRLAARAWIGLLHVGAYLQARYSEAERLGQQIQALINRLGGDDGLQAHLEYYRGAIAMELGHSPEAEAQLQKALKLFEKSVGAEHAYTAATLDALSVVQINHNRYDEALVTVKRALELTERVQGPEHPDA